jgi:UDP-glucose 4-epimerase
MSKQSKHVLVTGGAGYIGSHTAKALAAHGFVPVTYDNLTHGHRWAVQWGPFVEGDIRDRVNQHCDCLVIAYLRRRSVLVTEA